MSGFLGEGNAYDRVFFIESGVLGALDKRTCGTDAVRDRARPPRTETVTSPIGARELARWLAASVVPGDYSSKTKARRPKPQAWEEYGSVL